MRNLNTPIILNASNATANFNEINASQMYSASFIAVFSDVAAAGTLKVQASNDWSNSGNLPSDFAPAANSWIDIPSASVVVAAGATSLVPMPLSISYRWLRLVWTRTAGAGTFSVYINAQGF